jgi:hypothetical protein
MSNETEFVVQMPDDRRAGMLRVLDEDGQQDCTCADPKDNDIGRCLACGGWINYSSKA